jgi:hypothetical protein
MDQEVRPGALGHEAAHLIDRLGGTVAVARLCEVSSQAVTQWRHVGIPRARMMYLRAVRPAVFAVGNEVAVSADDAATPTTGAAHAA